MLIHADKKFLDIVQIFIVMFLSISLQSLKEELEQIQPGLDVVHETGEELVGLIGEPDKPEVEKNVDDMDSTWDTVNSELAKKNKELEEALNRATAFQDELMVGKQSYWCSNLKGSYWLIFKVYRLTLLSCNGHIMGTSVFRVIAQRMFMKQALIE